jgi:thiosulfate/3-mercaptopyruvate sulfurtransferase
MTNESGPSPLIEAQELAGMLGRPGLLVLDCRYELGNPTAGRNAYETSHIPGAAFASMDEDLASPRRPDTGRHPLPSPAAFAATLGRWGFTASSQVVAYDQASAAYAARLWWMLRARGHRAVQVLNGGYAAWLAAGCATTTAAAQLTPTSVPVRDFEGVVTSADVVTGLAARNITLVDARAADRFAGRNETVDPVAGHVPGAMNMPFSGNLGADQKFLAAAQLQQRWSLVNRPAAPLVAMCGSGITACHNLLAMAVAGFGPAQLYAGSYSEWITDPARPVVTEDVGT